MVEALIKVTITILKKNDFKETKAPLSLSLSLYPLASDCGENLFMASYKAPYVEGVQTWYNEIKNWAYGVGSANGKMVGHFTQVGLHNCTSGVF